MFSSNQKLVITGEYSQLSAALSFAIDMSGCNKEHLGYQIANKKYAIGWIPSNTDSNSWQKFQFDFDPDIVSKIIIQHLKKMSANATMYDRGYDGSTAKGFYMSVIDNNFSDEWDNIKDPFYGIVYIKPYINYYAK